MSTTTILATTLAAGVLGAGAAMSPLVATDGDTPGPWGGSGMHERADHGRWRGSGMGPAHGMMGDPDDARGTGPRRGGLRMHDDDCLLADRSVGDLTAAQARTLADLAEEEKLSHDLYVALADAGQDARFDRVAVSESHHLAALRTLMSRYDVDDPTAGLDPGQFASEDVAARYRGYLDRGTTSPEEALRVARQVEEQDVTALRDAAEHVDAPDVARVYEHLAGASRMHLEAFGG